MLHYMHIKAYRLVHKKCSLEKKTRAKVVRIHCSSKKKYSKIFALKR